jgi:hypothetical protein
MSYLEELAKKARYKLWTVRTHLGEGIGEQQYFRIVEERLAARDKPLEDFRRIIRVTPKSREHLFWLVDHLSQYPHVKVLYFEGGGPQFDFMSVDGEVAVIGFAKTGGKGNIGGIVLRGPEAVGAVDVVFTNLETDSKLLFEGEHGIDQSRKDEFRTTIEAVLARAVRN